MSGRGYILVQPQDSSITLIVVISGYYGERWKMPQSKEVHKEYMRARREGSQEGSQTQGSQPKGSQDWETIPVAEIKKILPEHIQNDIIIAGVKKGNTEMRFRRAYKYHLWHQANFINGVHKDSKYGHGELL